METREKLDLRAGSRRGRGGEEGGGGETKDGRASNGRGGGGAEKREACDLTGALPSEQRGRKRNRRPAEIRRATTRQAIERGRSCARPLENSNPPRTPLRPRAHPSLAARAVDSACRACCSRPTSALLGGHGSGSARRRLARCVPLDMSERVCAPPPATMSCVAEVENDCWGLARPPADALLLSDGQDEWMYLSARAAAFGNARSASPDADRKVLRLSGSAVEMRQGGASPSSACPDARRCRTRSKGARPCTYAQARGSPASVDSLVATTHPPGRLEGRRAARARRRVRRKVRLSEVSRPRG